MAVYNNQEDLNKLGYEIVPPGELRQLGTGFFDYSKFV